MILAGGFLMAVAVGFILAKLDLSLAATVLAGLAAAAVLITVALVLELFRQRRPESPAQDAREAHT
jgi:NADH:ubiquinone oxidoreductase subunit K